MVVFPHRLGLWVEEALLVDDALDKFRFVNEIGTQNPPHLREERRTHSAQRTLVVTHAYGGATECRVTG
jgi:hypothetical protein